MRRVILSSAAVALLALTLACSDSTAPNNSGGGYGGGNGGPNNPPPPPPPPAAVLLKDIVISNLPSPYYHFTYDSAGRVDSASFASSFTMYHAVYQGDRLTELRNNTLGNADKLVYTYDGSGRVSEIDYIRPDGSVSTKVKLSYDGTRLTGLERARELADSFVVEKTMSFSYYPDGNLMELTDHRPAVEGFQPASTTVDRFENYDTGINVDGFSLLHNDFFDHLDLLPSVILQKGNPRKVTRTGDGENYTVTYTYSYDAQNRPRSSNGDLLMQNGANAGPHFQVGSAFTYY